MSDSNIENTQSAKPIKKGKKLVISIVSTVLLICIVAACIVIDRKNAADFEKQQTAYSYAITPLNNQRSELKTQLAALERQHKLDILGKSCAVMCYNQTNSNLYNVIYPTLKKMGLKGVMVFRGVSTMPGEKDMITMDQFNEMTKAGWDVGLACNEEADFSKYDEDRTGLVTKWRIFIEDSLKMFRDNNMKAPTVFYFDSDYKYVPKNILVNVLRAHGFIGAVYPGNDDNIVYNDDEFTNFKMIGYKCIFETGSTVQSLFGRMNVGGIAAAISANIVDSSIKDSITDCSLARYKRMLVAATKTYDGIQTTSFTEFVNYRNSLATDKTEINQKFEADKATIEKKIEEIEEKIYNLKLE